MAVCQILLICPSAMADCTSHFAFAYPPIAHIALASLVTRVIGVLCHVHERATNQLLFAATTLSDFLPLRDWDLMCGLVCHVPSAKGLP